MTLRETALWLQDFMMNGSEVRGNMRDIENIVELRSPVPELLEEKRLNELMAYVVENVPYYEKFRQTDFYGFPVVNKITIRENEKEFMARNFDITKAKAVTTSGSTGTPFTVYHDKKKRLRHSADNLFFMKMAGYNIGSPLYYMRVWNKMCRHGILSAFLTNIKQIEIGNLSDSVISQIINGLQKDKRRKALLAFASTYEAFYQYLYRSGVSHIDANIETIISMSEHLSDDTRKEIEKIFGSSVVSRYSNMENGFIAQQPVGEDFYLINNASYKVELLDLDRDVPVGLGKLGRIVITDLFNYSMPLIRYDTGDLGMFGKVQYRNRDVVALVSVEGRKADTIFQTNGNIASSHIITNTMWPYKEIRQWQFVQVSKCDYKFIINGHIDDVQKQELENTLKEYLGEDAHFDYEFVNDIPVLSSGKRRMIVNQMTK